MREPQFLHFPPYSDPRFRSLSSSLSDNFIIHSGYRISLVGGA